MKSAAAVCALAVAFAPAAGCFRAPALDAADSCAIACGSDNACPDNRSCTAGFCLLPGAPACDPSSDGPHPPADATDASLADDGNPWGRACTAGSYGNALRVTTGATSFTTNGANSAGEYPAHEIRLDGLAIFESYQLPRLTAGNLEIFMEGYPTASLVHSKFTAGAWTQVAPVTTTGVAGAFFPGTVSATTPRRMIVSSGTATLLEGVEDGDGDWAFTALPQIPTLTKYREPSLSSDALRVVFLGTPTTGADQLYVMTRTSLDQAFGAPRSIFDFGTFSGTPHGPFLPSDNCGSVYFDNGADTYRADAI